MDSSNPYAASEVSLEEAYGWTERGTLIVEPTDEVIELPRICYSSGETENLVEESLTLRFHRHWWLGPTAVFLGILGPAASWLGYDQLRWIGLAGIYIFYASLFVKGGKVKLRAFTTRAFRDAKVSRRKFYFTLLVPSVALCAFWIIRFPTAIGIAFAGATLLGFGLIMRRRPKVPELASALNSNKRLEISGFCPEFHVTKQAEENKNWHPESPY